MSRILVSWDFRSNKDNFINEDEVKTLLKEFCKEWVFQLEKGKNTGYEHWQGRFRLKDKTNKSGLLKKMPKMNYLEPTSVGVHDNKNFNYVMKDDTRLKGPWKSIDAINCTERKGKPPIIEHWYSRFNITLETAYPFQKTIINSYLNPDDRSIDVVLDTKGQIGKTKVCNYIIQHGIGIKIPATITSADDIMQMLACELDKPDGFIYDPQTIIIDMPRAMKKEHLHGLFSACEEIKNGWCYDKRYKFRKLKFMEPRLWIFTNSIPDHSYLSNDRWNVWEVNENKELVKYNPSQFIDNGVEGERSEPNLHTE